MKLCGPFRFPARLQAGRRHVTDLPSNVARSLYCSTLDIPFLLCVFDTSNYRGSQGIVALYADLLN